MADSSPHFQEVANVSANHDIRQVLLDNSERLLESSRLQLNELEQSYIAIGLNLPGYTSRLELLRHELFDQIDYFLDTTQKMLELFEIAYCLDAAAFYPDYPSPNAIGYTMFQLVYLYGMKIVHDRVVEHQPHLTALEEELKTLRTGGQNWGY